MAILFLRMNNCPLLKKYLMTPGISFWVVSLRILTSVRRKRLAIITSMSDNNAKVSGKNI